MKAKSNFIIFFLLLNCLAISFGFDLKGIVKNKSDNRPVENANVVIVELDLIQLTDSEGNFTFRNIKQGKYSLVIIAAGYKEKKISVSLNSNGQLDISLEPLVIEMQKISVVAKKSEEESLTASIFDKDEIDNLPTGGNPYNPINLVPGIVFSGTIIENTSTVISSDLPASNFYPFTDANLKFSVLGGESDWNNFYYDYIKLPYSFHPFGIPFPRSVIPEQLDYSLLTYMGSNPVTKGPGIGGLFIIKPSPEVPRKNRVIISPSLSYLDIYTERKFSEKVGLILSLRKSMFEYTYFPVFKEQNMINNSVNAGNGDMLARLYLENDNSIVLFDLLGFYDFFGQDLTTQPEGSSRSILYFISTGIKWDLLLMKGLKNQMYIYFSSSAQERMDNNWDDIKQSFVLGKQIKINFNSLVGSDELFFPITDMVSWRTGIRIKYNILSALYSTKKIENIEEEVLVYDEDRDEWVSVDGELKSYGTDYKDALSLAIIDPYFYSRLIFKTGNANLVFGSGVSWLPLQNVWRFSLESEGDITFADNIVTGVRLGWSPASINEIAYMQNELNEKLFNSQNASSLDDFPISASSILFFKWFPNANSIIEFQPYFAWYYNLSGLIYETSYKTTLDYSGKPVFPNTDKGFSTGIDISWDNNIDTRFKYYFVYSLSWTRYLVKDIGWVDANTDIRHTFKNSFFFRPIKNFLIGSNFLIFFDKPFTPYKVTDSDGDGIGDSLVPEKLNSARDLIPRFKLDFQIKWDFNLFNGTGSLFMNTANLLAFVNPVLSGIKKDKETTIGASTKDFENRNYQFQGKQNNLLQTEIGVSIEY